MEHISEQLGSAEKAVLDEAEKVHQERMEVVRDLAACVARRVDLEQQIAEAQKEEKRLATAAEKAGWTAAQVKRFAKKARESPRKKKPSEQGEQTQHQQPQQPQPQMDQADEPVSVEH